MLIEHKRPWDFLLDEAVGERSRERGMLAGDHGFVEAGTLLSTLEAGADAGKLIPFVADPLNSQGVPASGALIVGVLGMGTDTSQGGVNADTPVAYLARDAEVNINQLVGLGGAVGSAEYAYSLAQLKGLGIIPR